MVLLTLALEERLVHLRGDLRLLVVGALAGIKVSQVRARMGQSFVPPPESVTSSEVESAVWESRRTGIGSLVAVHNVTLGTELPGVIRAVGFDSGQDLRRGAVLVKIDTSNEEAQLPPRRRIALRRTSKEFAICDQIRPGSARGVPRLKK
jgi:multidrug efflux pump subunit AcrA (membrane-fusion protein)